MSRVVAWVIAGALAGAVPLRAQCEVEALPAPSLNEAVNFGAALALVDGVAVVGNGSGLFGGAPSYVYEPAGEALFEGGAALAPDNFTVTYGYGVDIEGDTIVVAGQDNDDPNIIGYVFERAGGTWSLADKLEVPYASYQFGSGLRAALEDDAIVIASGYDSVAWVFLRDAGEWALSQTLTPDAPPFTTFFASSVSLEDGRAVLGGSDSTAVPEDAGTAWVFERQGDAFVETAQLVTLDGETYDNAGANLAQDGDLIVLGAAAHDHFTGENWNLGAVFVFERQGGAWVQIQFLTAPVPRKGDAFGASVALQGDTLLVGAPLRDKGGPDAGRVYVFHREASGRFEFTTEFGDEDPAIHGRFGQALAMEGGTVLVGGPGSSAEVPPRVRVVRGVPGLDDWVPFQGGVAGALGEPCVFGQEEPAVGGPAVLGLTSAPTSTVGWLVAGFTRVVLPFKGGLLGPEPQLLLPVATDALGQLEAGWTWPAAVPPGTKLWLQFWLPDATAPFDFAASDTLSVDVP